MSIGVAWLLVGHVVAVAADDGLDREWIAEYVAGESATSPQTLTLLADHRFVYRAGGASAIEYQGAWSGRGGILELAPQYDETRERFPDLPVRWRPVRWGARRYLVPEGKMIRFCNAINLGLEPREAAPGVELLRRDDWQAAVREAPAMPEEWSAYLLPKPLTGTIVDFEDGGFARLDLGGDQGLKAGMELLAHVRGEARCCRVKVVCPCEDRARVDIVGGDSCGLSEAPFCDLALGDEVSTSRALLNWRRTLPDGIELVFVPEMQPLPLELEPRIPGDDAAAGEAFARAWSQSAAPLARAVTPADLERLSRWCVEAGPPGDFPAAWLQRAPLSVTGTEKGTGRLLFGHAVEAGAPMPARRAIRRRLCVSALFDPQRAMICTVYVTIRGWVEE